MIVAIANVETLIRRTNHEDEESHPQAIKAFSEYGRRDVRNVMAASPTVILNTVVLVDPSEARPNPDPLPLWSRDEQASRSCAALGGRLSRAAEFASLSRGLV